MRHPTPQDARANGTQARREQGRPSGWDRYLSVLERARVPVGQRRWYVQGAEAFVGAMRPKRLSEVSAAEIKAFLPRYAREQRLNDWQFRQTVDALQLLLVDLAQCPGAREVEWDFLRESGASLGANHPTVAAASTPEQVIDASPVYTKSSTQQPLLKQLARTLRARRYALRTEQTYVDWCHRFLLFVAAQPEASAESLANIGKHDVERFLAHLAVDRNVAASTQNQALNALVFLFRHVLDRPLDEIAFSRTRGSRPTPSPASCAGTTSTRPAFRRC
jgi:hypothetical protein